VGYDIIKELYRLVSGIMAYASIRLVMQHKEVTVKPM